MSSRSGRPSRAPAYAVGAVILLLLGILIGGHPSWLPSPLRSVFVADSGGGLVGEALDALEHDYYRPVNPSTLIDRGLAGAIASLDDPYSHYFDPADYRSFQNDSNPHLSGIGVELDRRGRKVLDVFAGSPASRAGLQAGDVIVAVGGVSLAGRSADFSSHLIKGPAGTKVTLTVIFGVTRRTVTLTRASIVVPVTSSKLATINGVRVGIISLTSFTDGSGAEVRGQVQGVLHQGARALVLDLRSNGGGLLDEAVNVASVFIPDGTIVSTDGRSQPRQVYVAKGDAISTRIPLVVLVDRGTASSAEIVTGALRDRGRAKVVGTRTYGKGVFQALDQLSNGGALEIVTGRWFEPSGHNVGGPGVTEGAGIQPDIPVPINGKTPGDQALRVAEQSVAAEVP